MTWWSCHVPVNGNICEILRPSAKKWFLYKIFKGGITWYSYTELFLLIWISSTFNDNICEILRPSAKNDFYTKYFRVTWYSYAWLFLLIWISRRQSMWDTSSVSAKILWFLYKIFQGNLRFIYLALSFTKNAPNEIESIRLSFDTNQEIIFSWDMKCPRITCVWYCWNIYLNGPIETRL